jgi:thioredoxin 1
MEYTFTEKNFNQDVLNAKEPVMIDFYADWCQPCRMMGPSVKKFADKYDGKIRIGKVNIDQNPNLAAKFNVMSIPNFVFIQNGKVVDQAIGAMPAFMLEKKLKKLL